MIRLTARRTVIGVALLGVLGCGQKGALYLPDHNAAVVTRPAGASQNTQQPATQQPAQTPQTGAAPAGTGTPSGAPTKKRTDKDDDSASPK